MVDGARQIHRPLDPEDLASHRAGAPGQGRQVATHRPMEAFDEGGVEHPAARDRMAERFDGLGAPLYQTAFDPVEAAVDIAFDDLDESP